MSELDPSTEAWLNLALDHALAGLHHNGGLAPEAGAMLRQSVRRLERYPAGALVNASTRKPEVKWIVTGWASEMRILPDSRRQICSFLIPGDVFTARPANSSSCGVVALTRMDCADVERTLDGSPEPIRPAVWEAVARSLSLMLERRYEHITRLGQLGAAERLVHLLLELRERLEAVGLAAPDKFRLPLTQEHLADALGLSIVHVNRTLRHLRAQRLLEVKFGGVALLQPARLADIAGRFDEPV